MSRSIPEVDVIVVSHEARPFLANALRSISRSVGVRATTTVVDNASSDRSADLAQSLGAKLVLLPDNVGYGAAFNAGLASTQCEWVVCANQDIELSTTAVATLVETASAYEERTGVPCIVGPRLVTPDGRLVETCHRIPRLSQQMLAFLLGERAAGCRNAYPAGDEPQRCGWVSATFIVGRRSTFESVGGFDPSYFLYVEDLDFFTRLATLGYHCVWVPRAHVVHFGGSSAVSPPEVYGGTLLNWRRYYSAKSGRLAGTAILASALAGTLMRAGLWWGRSLRGDELARARARMFSGAALVAAKRSGISPGSRHAR